MKLAHPGNDRLTGFLVGRDAERRVFLREALQADGKLFLVRFRRRFDGHGNDRFRERRRLEHEVVFADAERVAGDDFFRPDQRADVSGIRRVDFFAVHRLHDHEAGNAFRLARARIIERVALLQRAAVEAEEHELADVRVGPQLEAQTDRLRVVVRFDARFRFAVVLERLHRRQVKRGRQVIDDRVEHHLDALVLEGRARNHADEVQRERRFADGDAQLVRGNFLPFEVFFRDRVVEIGNGLDQRFAIFFIIRLEVRGNVRLGVFHALRVAFVVNVGTALDEVDEPRERFARADGNVKRMRVPAKLFANALDGVEEIRSRAVHLVDVGDARNVVFVHLAPNRFGLRLNAGDRAENGDRAVENAERALDFRREVDVSGRVDDVQAMRNLGERSVRRRPPAGNRRGRNRDSALLFLLHPVRRRGAFVNFAGFVNDACIEKNALGRRRFPRVNVRGDAEVSRVFERRAAGRGVFAGKCHSGNSFSKNQLLPQRRCANARFACAILCVSSRFLTTVPVLL